MADVFYLMGRVGDRTYFRASKRLYAFVGGGDWGVSFSNSAKPGFSPVYEVTKNDFDRLNALKVARIGDSKSYLDRYGRPCKLTTGPQDSWVLTSECESCSALQAAWNDSMPSSDAVFGVEG